MTLGDADYGDGRRQRERATPLARLVAGVETCVSVSAQAILATTLVALFITLFANVVLRYAFGGGLPWSGDLSRLLFPWLAISGAVLAALGSQNIAIDIVYRLLPEKGKAILAVIINVIVVVLAGAVVYGGVIMMEATAGRTLPVLDVSVMYAYASLVYGYGCIGLLCLTNTYQVFTRGPIPYKPLS